MKAGYFLPREPFYENLGSILTYAIFGTLFNAMAIGASMYGVSQVLYVLNRNMIFFSLKREREFTYLYKEPSRH